MLTAERLVRLREEYTDLMRRMPPWQETSLEVLELIAEIERLRVIVELYGGQPDAKCATCKHRVTGDGEPYFCGVLGDNCTDDARGCAAWEAK